jgi:hypothetical protein
MGETHSLQAELGGVKERLLSVRLDIVLVGESTDMRVRMGLLLRRLRL